MKKFTLLICFFFLQIFNTAFSKPQKDITHWVSVTVDNDAFVGNDSGYSNGLFVSTFEVNGAPSGQADNDWWVKPLMWSMPLDDVASSVNAYSFGQSLNTPSDIKVENPSLNELPYSALLVMSNSYIAITPEMADIATTAIGMVGPMAFGEEVQSFVHKVLGANEPKGWHTQIGNEFVFEFTRGRSYRVWHDEQDQFDVLFNGGVSLGTIESSVNVGAYFRYGNNLAESYATTLLSTSRISNPLTINGWYVFFGSRVGYMFNHIGVDGNTFRDSRSIDYQHRFIGLSTGIAYTWRDVSITFAINDFNILQENIGEKVLADLTEFGTISFSWKI